MSTGWSAPAVGALCDELIGTASALAAVMRQVADAASPAVGVWTVGEAAAHVSGSADYFLGAARGDRVRERIDQVDVANARALAAEHERDPRRLAARLEAGEAALAAFAREADDDPLVQPFEGVEVPLSTLLGIELGELLVHGFDIANAAGLGWRISPEAALLTLQAYLPLLPFVLDRGRARGLRLALEIRVRGMRPMVVSIADQRLAVHRANRGARVDAHMAVSPVAYLLLTWNRVPAWKAIVRGQLLVWGRHPGRAAQLGDLMLL